MNNDREDHPSSFVGENGDEKSEREERKGVIWIKIKWILKKEKFNLKIKREMKNIGQ